MYHRKRTASQRDIESMVNKLKGMEAITREVGENQECVVSQKWREKYFEKVWKLANSAELK